MLLYAIEVLLFPLTGLLFFFFGYLCIRFGFFGAPYNGVYKFSAVFFPGVELETKVYCCPVKDGGLDRNCAVNLHN